MRKQEITTLSKVYQLASTKALISQLPLTKRIFYHIILSKLYEKQKVVPINYMQRLINTQIASCHRKRGRRHHKPNPPTNCFQYVYSHPDKKGSFFAYVLHSPILSNLLLPQMHFVPTALSYFTLATEGSFKIRTMILPTRVL